MPDITIKYMRTVRPREYESKSAEAWLTTTIPDTVDEEVWMENAFQKLEATVLSQLGVDYLIDGITGKIVETVPEPVTVQDAADMVVTMMPGTVVQQAPTPGATPITPGTPGPCRKCNGPEWWDNRADNNRRRSLGFKLGPDWKCRNCGNAMWPDDFNQYKHLPREPR